MGGFYLWIVEIFVYDINIFWVLVIVWIFEIFGLIFVLMLVGSVIECVFV